MSESVDRPEVSFIAFIFSLASNAAVHFGDLPDPLTNETRAPDLEAAAQLIEIIAMLEAKTRGNLTPEERQLIEQILFELRMRYVEAKKARAPSSNRELRECACGDGPGHLSGDGDVARRPDDRVRMCNVPLGRPARPPLAPVDLSRRG